jgi:hypothetical protein
MREVISTFNVRGVSFEGRQGKIQKLLRGKKVQRYNARLIPEPDNPYDINAIGVKVQPDDKNPKALFHIGYVPRELCTTVLMGMEQGFIEEYPHEISVHNGQDSRAGIHWATLKVLSIDPDGEEEDTSSEIMDIPY